MVSFLRADEPAVPPELHGILATGRDHCFALVASGGGRSNWVVVGEAFAGWKLEEHLAADEGVVLSRDNRRVTVYLKPNWVETGPANGPTTGSDLPAANAAADDVLSKMKFDAMWDRIAEEQRKSIVGAIRQQAAAELAKQGLPEPEIAMLLEKMGDAVVAGLQSEVMRQDFARIFAEVYTLDELRGMANFYETAAGNAWTAKQPEVQQKLMQAMMPRVMQGMPAAHKIAAEYLRQRAARAAAGARTEAQR